MDHAEKDIELFDYLRIIWIRKWVIIIPTFLFIMLAGVCNLRQPVFWEAQAILQPSNFFLQAPSGRMEKFMMIDPSQLAIQINQGAYNRTIAEELHLQAREIPVISAVHLRDPEPSRFSLQLGTDLIHVSTAADDSDRAKTVLYKLFDLIRKDLDEKIEVETININSKIARLKSEITKKEIEIQESDNQIELTRLQIRDKNNEMKIQENAIVRKQNEIQVKKIEIESKDIEKAQIGKGIKSEQRKIEITEERIKGIIEEMKIARQRTDELEAQQKKALFEKRKEGEALSMLLYSNEIQKNLQYYNDLDESLNIQRVQKEDLILSIEMKQEAQKQIDKEIEQIGTAIDSIHADVVDIKTLMAAINNDIDKIKNMINSLKIQGDKIKAEIRTLEADISMLEAQKGRISYTQLIKEPEASLKRMGRNPIMTVMAVGLICLIAFTLLAFFIDYIKRHKAITS